ncbi:Protein AATF [Orchesella cincta]|uniref:Protein AATF n=1 Tax=Orchesella cincta TaxID=48709 RepID=A0A1D2NGB7_ORCCI|nr:Protein AATF [Orchesella cincta]
MAKKKLSLGERIALAAAGSHEEEFPEDIEYETSAKVADLDDEFDKATTKPSKSSLRTKNIQLLDELDTRYAGTKVTRRKLAKSEGLDGLRKPAAKTVIASSTEDEGIDGSSEDDDDDDSANASVDEEVDLESMEDGGYEDDAEEKEESAHKLSLDGDMENEEDESGDEDSMGSDESEDEDADSDVDEKDAEAVGMQMLSLRDKEAEIEKGRATLNQLRIWDSMLEVRIRLQKMLLDCNRLPRTDEFKEITEGGDPSETTSGLNKTLAKSQESIKILMHELIQLQNAMIEKNSETKKGIKPESEQKKAIDDDPMNEEITSEDSDAASEDEQPSTRKRKVAFEVQLLKAKKMKIEDFIAASQDAYNSFVPFRNQTIQKWNDKTQFAGGKFNRKTTSQQISTLKQIEQILSNKERLLKRTQVRRSNYEVIGSSSDITPEVNLEKVDPEIFDDDDFYHQLLRELIERKTSNVNDPIQLSHHWLELQKLRSKLKRKVDTKASKGRKIRYDVHSKLVNFMAPQDNCTMSTAAVKELFSSLFGKMKE